MGKVQRSMENTGNQASGALSRRLFGPAHPNHTREPEARLAALRETSADDLRAYHRNHFGATEWTLVFVGDVDHAAIEEVVREAFGDWEGHGAPATHDAEPADTEPGRSTVPLPDKSNVDVRIGHALPLRRDHDDYVALYVGNYILGGNFSARLMSTVRDEKGLTYHIGSRLSGVTTRYAGSWQASVTLSQEKLEAGIEATEAVVRDFVESGAEPDELDAVKTTITGAYKVGLSTTTRLAQSVLTNAERGFDLGYLDRFPDEVNALSLEDVNDAVARYLRPGEMHRALAGTLPEAAGAAAGADA
jgi:predicted Zn-dependent peptidase